MEAYFHSFSFFPGIAVFFFFFPLFFLYKLYMAMETLPHSPPYWKKRNEHLSQGIFFLTIRRMIMVGKWRRTISVFLFLIAEPRSFLAYIFFTTHFLTPFKLPTSIVSTSDITFKSTFSFSSPTTLPYFSFISFLTAIYYKTYIIGYSIVSLHYSSSFTVLSKFSF